MAILLDFLRDPVRKMDPSESVLITISVLGLWAVITVSAWMRSRNQIQIAFREHPRVFSAIRYLAIAMIPGSILSLALYQGGYKMVGLGVISYLAPFAGILLGYLISRRPKDISGFMMFYCIVNGIALTGVIAEYSGANWPALGGLRGMEWIRYSGQETVKLIGGLYRSPDIMGLHAAQVVMFSLTLAIQKSRRQSPIWIVLALFGCLCLLLSGRRKMLGMPLVFLAVLALLTYIRKITRVQAIVVPIVAAAALIGGVFLVATDEYVGTEYMNFAGTLFTSGVERYQEVVVGSVQGTIIQSGVLGEGIGTATQGSYHLMQHDRRQGRNRFSSGGWQEDGVSRIFRELGLFGVIFVVLSAWSLIRAIMSAVQRVPASWHGAVAQLCMISIVVANLASFTVSHQQFSGDPPSALLVLIVLGIAFGVTSIAKARKIKQLERRPRHSAA
ncbi:hypothetical protein [Stieleria varia]|nr:hypothetical protein [Stieleria varia]